MLMLQPPQQRQVTNMMIQSVVTRDDGYRGWRHENAVTTKWCLHDDTSEVGFCWPRSIVPFSDGKLSPLLFALRPGFWSQSEQEWNNLPHNKTSASATQHTTYFILFVPLFHYC